MKVFLVWYSYPYDPGYELFKVFNSREKAQDYIDNLLSDDEEDYDKQDLFIEEREVE